MCRVAVEEAQIALIDGAHVVADRAVVAAAGPCPREARRQRHLRGDLGRCEAAIGKAQGLVVQIAIEVAVAREELHDPLFAPARPVVLGEHHIRVCSEQLDGLAQVLRPAQRVAHERAARREHVVQAVGGVLRHAQHALLGEVEVHLHRRLALRNELEEEAHAVDLLFLTGRGHLMGGRYQGDRAARCRLADARVDLTPRPALQTGREHVGGATRHRGAGEHVLADRLLQEPGRRPHRHLAPPDRLLRDHALDAAEVVDVAVAVDDRAHRSLAAMAAVEFERRRGALHRDQRVDHDHAAPALDERDVGEVIAAHLVDARHDLE